MLQHIVYIVFLFALGACVGSFLNVVVWRLPRGESLVSPPSHCPRCNTKLAWYDNIPVFGWIALRGKCRYCRQPISPRYPIIEAITGLLSAGYYVAFFIYQMGMCATRPMSIADDWPMYGLYMFLVAALLAASLIDAELFIIPIEIPWLVAVVGILVHAIIDTPRTPGTLTALPPIAAMAAGSAIGLVVSLCLMRFDLIPQSFAEGGPLLEIEKRAAEAEAKLAAAEGRQPKELPAVEFTPAQIRGEMRKEMIFLMPPLLLGGLWLLATWKIAPLASFWDSLVARDWVAGLLGSLWGGLVGAFTIWLVRILGSMFFGREAMGLGDAHLMFGVGAVIGAAGSVAVFFLAPFLGLAFAIYKLIRRTGRELPYGPYLSFATGIVLLTYCRIIEHFGPQLRGLIFTIQDATAR